MRSLFILILFISFAAFSFGQTQPIEKPAKGYRFQERIKGPNYKKSKILELMVDEHGNYLVATFRGEKASYVYLYVYNLYTWEEKYKVKLDDNRCELYNSSFDQDGEHFYVNYDIYRNKFKKINLATGNIEEIDCAETPKGCKQIEPQYYKIDAYTIGENYYIHRDEKFENYMRIMVKKEMYIPKSDDDEGGFGGFGNFGGLDPEKGGTIQFTPTQIRELKAGQEITVEGIAIFYDANAIDYAGNVTAYTPEEGAYKVRLTSVEISKLDKKVSFLYDKFVLKLDLDAWEAEQNQ